MFFFCATNFIKNVMKITENFLNEIITFLFEQVCDDIIKSDLEIDKKYFEGQRNAFKQIHLILEGDNDELLHILNQICYKKSVTDEELFF